MRIRPATETDWDRIAELTVAAYVDGGFLTAGDSYVAHLSDVGTRARGSQLLVAEVFTDDGAAVAASVAVTDAGGPMAEVARAGEMEFRMLAVAPEHQGRGIARAMVRHIIEVALVAAQRDHAPSPTASDDVVDPYMMPDEVFDESFAQVRGPIEALRDTLQR